MKIVIVLLLTTFLYADTLLVINAKGDEGKKTFLKRDGDVCYYKNGYQNSRNCYRETGNILIKFQGANAKEIAKKYNLKYIEEINAQNRTLLYKSLNSKMEIITLVNIINKENSNLTARVEWITPRRLY